MSQNQNKHLQQQQQLEHHQLQQQQHHHHQQQLLHHHHQQQHQQQQQRQWHQQYQQQQQQLHHHHQQQQQQQQAQYAAAAAAHAHVAAATGMRSGNGMPGMFGNTLGRGGCLYDTSGGSLVGGGNGGGGGVGGFDLDMAGHHIGSGNASAITATSTAPAVGVGIAGGGVGGYLPSHVNVSSVAGGAYNAGMSGMPTSSESGRRTSVGGCAYTQASQSQPQPPPQQPQQQLQQHTILPPERIKMEPLEQILTPTIEMEELIIKTEPTDDAYNKVSTVDEAIATGSTNMNPNAGYMNFPKHLQPYPQHQQQQQQQQLLEHQKQRQKLQHQQHALQQQQHLHQQQHQHLQQQQQLQQQHQQQQREQQLQQQMLSHDAMAEAGLLTVKLEPQIHIKEEMPEASQNKPLNFPRRKVQTERSDTLPICQRCKQVFFKKQSYSKHVSQSLCEIVEYDFKCSICPMSFTSSEELQTHEQLHRENMYFCHKYCGKYFDTIELCEVHEYMQHEYVNYICNVCSAGFASRDLLFAHMPQHRNQPRYDCPVCRLWFHTGIQLHQHRIQAPYFCGKFYRRAGAAAPAMPAGGAPFGPVPPTHSANYNLQDCSMGIIEMPNSNSFSSYLQNRAFHHQHPAPPHPPLPPQQMHPHLAQQQQQQHLQRQQQQLHLQQQHSQYPTQPLHAAPQQPQPTPAQPDFMRRNSITGATGSATTEFQMPQIKTEIKVEPDLYPTPDYPLQTPLPPPPLPPPPLGAAQQSALVSPSRQRSRFGDFTNESFGAGGASGETSHAFGTHNNSSGSNGNSNDFSNSNTSSLQRSNSNDNNGSNHKPSAFPVGNFHFPTTPAVSRTRVVDTGEDGAVCCVPHCGVTKQSSPTLQFFTFPKDEKYLHQWLHNLKMFPEPDSTYSQYRICSLHFPKRCINRYSLCYWAVPTFNLGHDDVANLYQNREITNTFTVGERAQCSMPGCPSQRGESNCKFYNFPNDMKTRIKWCQNARLPVNSREPRHFCSRHFEDRCFGKFRLKPWAVPTLHLGTPYGRIHDNPGVFYLEEKKCCLPHCKRTRSSDFNLSLYRFPRDEVLLRRWCYNLRLDPAIYRGKNHKICSAHFIKEALGLRKLSPGAVPTLNLGHNDRFNIYENELPTPPVVPPSKMFNFHNVSAPPPVYSSHRHSIASSSSHSERLYPNPVSKLKFSISNITAGDVSSMSGSATQNILDSLEVCFVPSCKRNRNIDNVTLHTIPRRPEQMRKWCHNLKIGIETLHKGVRICSAHFEPYCIGGCMRPFAVPTLNLGHDDPNIYRNPDVIKKLNIRETCCVPDCKRNRDRDHANLHRFPSNFEMLTKWCENLLKPVPDGTKLFNDAICEVHFEERCIRNKRLEKWAVPTVKLGHAEEPKHRLPTDDEIAEQWPKPLMPNKGIEEGECCVSTCRRDPKIDDVKLYRTPEDPELLAKWAHNLQTETEDLTTLRICNLHFEEICFSKKRRLHYWSLPTLNLATNVEQLYENPEPLVPQVIIKSETKRERRRMRDSNEPLKPWTPRCCLPHCRKRRDTDHVQLFRFPVLNRPMLAKWCHNLQLPQVGNGHRRLCSTHFEPRVLSKRCPIPMSVPTLDLNTPPGYKIYMNPARLKAVKLQQVCCISSCSRTRADGVQLFRFPHSRSVLRKWCHNTRQHARGEYRVCSRHFEPHAFGAKRLMPGAIPTLNLDPEVEDVYANEAQSFAETQCVVSGCVASKELDGVRLFKFPSDDVDLLWKWCNNLKMNPVDCRGVRICNRHFEPECVGSKMLYKWAVPTLALGHNDADIKLVSVPPPEARYNDVVTKCCVPTCGKSRKFDDAQMNSFPKNLRLFRCWKHNLKLDFLDFKDREKYKICSDHFESVCLGKLRLNYGAIPTLNLGHDDTDDLYPVDPAQIQVSLFGKMRPRIASDKDAAEFELAGCVGKDDIKCSYPNCTATKMLLREPYDMPAALPLHALWCAQMKVDAEALSETPKLCGLHFIKLHKATLDAANALAEGDNELSEAMKSLNDTYEKCCASPIVCSAQCCVAGCGSNQISGSRTAQRLYLFPTAVGSGIDLLEKWCHNVDVSAADLSRFTHKVCARHFEAQCIGPTQRLRSWAIPTLQLQQKPEHKIHAIPELGSAARPHEARCCVATCARERGDFETMRLFSFPIIDEVLEKWLHNLQLTRSQCARLRICEQHFEPRCIVKTRLLRWAVPTLLLARNTEELLQNEPPVQAAAPAAPTADEVDAIDAASNIEGDEDMRDVDDEEDDNDSGELATVPNVKMKKSLGIFKCCVPSCRRTRLQHGVRLFQFPTSHQILRKWCHNLKISLEKASDPALRICSVHFHKRCIDGKELRPWAKPTNALGHSGPIYENPKNLPGVFLPKCCLAHCRQRRTLENDLRTFGFPKDEALMRKWCANLRMEPRANHARICMSHFPPEAMGNKKLRANAVPTLNLGHNEPLEYDNALLIATAMKARNPLEEKKVLTSDASDTELGNVGEYDDEMDDEDNDDDDDYRIDEEDDENDFYASAGVGNSDEEEEETVEDFTPSISAATGDDDELYSNTEARDADNFIVDSADEDEEGAEVDEEDEEDIYGNEEDDDEDDSEESDESVTENIYNSPAEEDESDSESEVNADNNNADSKDAEVDDDDVEMLIDADEDEDDKSSYNACDPLDFVECVNQSDDTQQNEAPATSTKVRNLHKAGKNTPKRPITLSPTNYEDDSNTNYSNADETTRFTATTSNSASATTSSASASAAATSNAPTSTRHCGADKINRSVFRLCCLRHRRKKKAPPDPPPDMSCAHAKAPAVHRTLMNSIARPRRQRAYCAVRRCGRTAGAAVTLYRFPLSGSRYCRRWCAQLKIKMTRTSRLRICQRHFPYSLVDRRRRRLRFGAIPTRNLYNTTAQFKRNPLYGLYKNTTKSSANRSELAACADTTQTSAAQLNVYNRCCVPHCGKSHQVDGVTLFRFPKLRSLYLQWATNLRLMPTMRLVQVYKVCSEHFEPQCLSYQRKDRANLKYGSVPTLKLGHNDTSKIYKQNTLLPQKRRGLGRRKWYPQKGVNECAVHDCKVAQFLQMQLFALPATLKLQERWCNYFKLNFTGASKDATDFFENVRLCALHYMEGYQMATYSDGARKGSSAALDELEANYARITSSTRIQMLKCCVPNCSTKFTDNVRLTAFPSAEELRAKWQHNTQVSFSPSHRYLYKVCALHFEERCFAKKRLFMWAIPTLHLPRPQNQDTEHKLFENPIFDSVSGAQCCIEDCATNQVKQEPAAANDDDKEVCKAAVRFWHFPQDDALREKWCHNLGLSALTNEISHTSRRWRICSRHFEQFCIGKTLRSWAVPTLHLPKPVKHAKSGRRSTYIYQNPDSAAVYYRCCIKTCHQMRDLDAGIRLYAFPKKETMLQKWAHNIRMPAVKCRYARICTLHFEAQCLRPQMQSWALPTIDLGHDEADIFRVPKVKLMVTNERCCLPHCSKRRSRDNVHLFTFPRDKDVLDKWWHNLAIGVQDVKRRLICESHFESRCISKRRLKRWAIPTLHLGHTNDTLKNPTPAEVASYENNTTARRSQTPSKMTRAKSTQPTAPTSTLQKCSIAQCARGADSSALYRFPKPDWLRKKWCDNTRIDEETAKQAKICARHFEPHVMGNRKPRPWALPTMELGADVNGAPLPVVHANPKQLSRFHPEEHEWGELRYVRANHCSIISCLKSKKDGVTLFNYPTKRHMLQKWAENCRHYPYQAKRYRFQLCGAHFTADCFKREGTRLRKGSVPTLNLGHDDAQIHQSEFESVSAIKIEMKVLKSCSVPQCGRTNLHDGVRLFKFPYERAETLEKWCHNLRMNAADCRNALICNMHFEPRCVGGGHRGLLLRAIPTLLLGHNDSDILNNPETFERPEKLISCCVPGCTNTKQTEGITLSAFPKLRSHFEKWAHNLQLPVSTTIWHTYKVCSAHFESYCYEHGRIKVGAMPTLKLGHSNAIDLYTVSEETMSQAFKRKRVAPKTETPKTPHEACCYPECREMELRLTNQLFEFPRLDNIRRAWYESVGLSAEEQAEEAGSVATENETQKSAPDNGMPQASDAAAAAATAPVKVTKISPKLCPMHFKLLYIEHAALLDTLKSDSTADTQRILHKLDETYTKVCDISCVRRISCAVPGCNSNYLTTKSLKFFKFPDNAEMRAKWCHNTQVIIDPDRLYCYKICELHFEASCSSQLSKKMQRLKSWALPTLQLPPRAADAPEIYALPAPDTLAETKRASLLLNAPLNKCCIASCVYAKAPAERAVSADSEIQFFNFPNDAELLYKWVYNTQISMVAATNARICSLHFEKHCINKRLRMYAVPTLLLGHQKTDIYKNPSDKRVAAEAIESKPPKLPKYYEDNVADDVEVEEEDEEEDEDDDDDDDDDDVLLADVKAHKMKLKKSDITKYKPEVLDENEARTVLKSAAHDEKKLDRALLEPMLVVKTEFKERKEVITTTTTNKTATQPKPYHQPFIINIKQEKDIEENYTAEGIENQMKQGLLDMFNSFGDTGAEQEPDDINELGDEVTQMERDTARHCRIVGCNSYARNAGVTLFKFPFPLDQFRKWLHNTQLEVDYTRRWRYRICHRHFEPICMQFRKLPPGTMPTLNLGPKRPAHIYENEFDVNSLSKYKTKPQQQNLTTTTTSNMFSELNDEADTSSSFAAPTHHNNDNIDPNADYNDDYADFVDNTPIDRDTSRHCRIPDCNSHAKDPGVTLFKFPMSEYLFHKWLYNTQLKVDYTRRWRYRICQRHFEPICMQFRKLPPGTMPTLNLGPSRPERIYENSFDINHLKKFKTKLKNNTTTTSTAIAPTSTSAITHSSHADYTDDLETSSSYAVDANVSNTAQLPLLSCTVRHCTSQYHALHEGLHLHKLPTNIMLREKWIYNCRFSEETLISMSSRIRICSLHFTPNCYYGVKRQLKFGSVPTLRLGHTDPNIYPHGFSNESEAQMAAKQHTAQHNWRTKRLQSSTDANQDICCLINCRHSSREYTRHFAFPSERELLDQWLNALGMEFNSSRPDDYKICEWHFKASDFDGEVLRADAVPTRNLKIDDANQTEEEDDNEDEDDDVLWNANEEPLDERPSTSAAAAAAASTTTPDGYNKLIPGSRRCCLAHCRKQLFQDNVRTFKFPTMHEQFEKWVHNLGIKYDGDAPWRYQICSEHFENQCIIHYENKAKLFRWAVPTLKLGKHAPAILFTNENPKKLQQRDADYERVYRNSNAGGYADNIDNEETMDTTNDELSSTAPPADAPKHMAYQQEDMDLLAPIERPPHKMSSATKRSNYAYTASNDDGDDYYDGDDDAYDMGDGENSLLNVIREEKPSAVKEGTPVSSFFSLQLVRGGSAKVRACCLPHCGRTRESGVRLFRFPTEPVFLKRWEYNLRVLFNESQRNTHLICSAHFERGQYNKRLVVDAIPTLNLGHNSNDIYRNGQYEPTRMHKRTLTASPPRIPSANSLPLSSHKPLYCNVPACADTQSKRRLYPFPSNHGFVKIWAERTQIAYDARHHAELRVCELHFETDCFSAHGLNNNAVPTLFLPAPNALPTPAAIAPVAPTKIPPPIGRSTAASTTMPKLSAITCSVTNCNNSTATRTDLKIFSKFPDDFELFTKWCFNLKIDPRTYVDGSYNVCSEHFEPFCIGGHSLRVWAVPTLRLGHNSKLIHSVERPAEMETKCCLPHCGRKKSKDGVEFYSFPKGDIYRQWCQILKIDEGLYRNTDKKICSAHFRADCFNSNGTLRLGARPTMLLRNRTATAAAHMLKPPAPYRSKCIVRICHEMQQLYSFPAQRNLCTKWCHNLKIDYYPKLHENMNFKICRRHFEPNCLLSGGKLHAEAVPTVQLGHSDVNIYQNLVGIKHSASTTSYDDNSSLRTSVSTVHTWLMDVDAETNAANNMPPVSSVDAGTGGVGVGAGATAVADDDMVRMEYEPPVDLEPTVVTENIADDNLDLTNSAYMQMEDDTYYADFEEQRLLPQSSTFIAAESAEVIDLDAVDAVQEQFPNWSQDDAVLVDDDDEEEDDDALLWPLN